MGSTVTCQKAAAAFRSPTGTPIYVLFESSYSKNVWPHAPRWACYHVGGIEGALRRVFGFAAACEGGLLQTRRCWTSPEAYVADWLRHLAAPNVMQDLAVGLSGGTSCLDAIDPDRIAGAAALLASHGLAEASRTLLTGGRAELRLHRDADAIAALCSNGLAVPHDLIRMVWPPGSPACDRDLGYAPARVGRTSPSPPALLKIDNSNLLMQAGDGAWHRAGSAYVVVGCHVRDAWEAELAAPGRYRTSIAALRTAARNAPPVPAGTQVLVHGIDGMDPRTRRAWAGIAGHYGATATAAGWQLAATPDVVGSLIYNLDRKHLSWLVPPLDVPPQARLALAGGPPAPA